MMRRRGAILLEAILSLAIVLATGIAVLACVDRAARASMRARELRTSVDMARTAMARLQAGLVTPQTLDGPIAWPVAPSEDDGLGVSADASGWELDIRTEPAGGNALTRVTVVVLRSVGHQSEPRHVYSLHGLIDLSRSTSPRSSDGEGP